MHKSTGTVGRSILLRFIEVMDSDRYRECNSPLLRPSRARWRIKAGSKELCVHTKPNHSLRLKVWPVSSCYWLQIGNNSADTSRKYIRNFPKNPPLVYNVYNGATGSNVRKITLRVFSSRVNLNGLRCCKLTVNDRFLSRDQLRRNSKNR